MSRKKPIAEHVKAGTFRRGRHSGAALPVESPPMPPDMRPVAQACWNTTVEECRFAGTLSRVDGKGLRLLSDSWALYVEAEDDITNRGIVVSEPAGHGGMKTKQNPAIAIRKAAWKEIQTMLAKFGLTPADRTGLKASPNAGANEDTRKSVKSILKLHG